MLTKVRSKLTYPHIASTLALFLALTGGAVALQGRNTVNSGDIKPQGVRSSDIKNNNGVKGADVQESSLGEVPSATNADQAANATNATNAQNADNADNATNAQNATNATNAQNADNADNATNADNADQADNATTVNNVTVAGVRYVQNNTGSAPTNVVNQGGLVLQANCVGGDLSLTADSSVNNATLSSIATNGGNDVHNSNFDDATAPINLLDTDDNAQVLTIQYTRPPGFGVLNPSGATTAVLQTDSDGETGNCVVSGIAFRHGGGFIIGPIGP
jgi:cytoskeletal protein RodZ